MTTLTVTARGQATFRKQAPRHLGIKPGDKIELEIHALLAAATVETNRPAVEAGLSVLEAGGDFADGVIACEGNWLDGETFVSFD